MLLLAHATVMPRGAREEITPPLCHSASVPAPCLGCKINMIQRIGKVNWSGINLVAI